MDTREIILAAAKIISATTGISVDDILNFINEELKN